MRAGWLADWAARHDKRGYLVVAAGGAAAGSPFYVAAMLADEFVNSLILLGGAAAFYGFYMAPTIAIIQSVVFPHMRATASAIMLLVVNLIAFGIGPIFVGMLSDWIAIGWGLGSAAGIRWAQIWSTAIILLALTFYWRAFIWLPKHLK